MKKSSNKSTKKSTKKAKCFRCKYKHSKDQAALLPGVGWFDVTAAEKILKDQPRKPILLSVSQLKKYFRVPHYSKRHLPHVDMSKPGILGSTDLETFILDGCHRGFNHLQEKKPFSVFELTPFETGSVLVRPHRQRRRSAATD
jgi:hypothetical protein